VLFKKMYYSIVPGVKEILQSSFMKKLYLCYL
jgi:hypothetical protein